MLDKRKTLVPPYLSEIGRFTYEVTGGLNSPILKPWAAEIVIEKLHGNATGRPLPIPTQHAGRKVCRAFTA